MQEVLVAWEQVLQVLAHATLQQQSLVFASVQVLGYAIYMRTAKDPHPLTWIMLAYGTAVWSLLAWANGTEMHVLYLPIACAVCSLYIAARCWHRGTWRWPEGFVEWFSFGGDIALTIAYVGAGLALWVGEITPDQRENANFVFLWGSNLTTFTSMAPLITEARKNPETERSTAWVIWFLAYLGMTYSTYQEEGFALAILFYPVVNVIIHGAVAYYVAPRERQNT